MKTFCLDTNFLLRFLINDIDKQAQEAENLLNKASAGEINCFVSIVVQMEIIYVLSSFYDQNKTEVCDKVSLLYDLNFIDFEYLNTMKKALEIYLKTSLSIQDAFLVSLSKENKMQFTSFDKKAVNFFNKQ